MKLRRSSPPILRTVLLVGAVGTLTAVVLQLPILRPDSTGWVIAGAIAVLVFVDSIQLINRADPVVNSSFREWLRTTHWTPIHRLPFQSTRFTGLDATIPLLAVLCHPFAGDPVILPLGAFLIIHCLHKCYGFTVCSLLEYVYASAFLCILSFYLIEDPLLAILPLLLTYPLCMLGHRRYLHQLEEIDTMVSRDPFARRCPSQPAHDTRIGMPFSRSRLMQNECISVFDAIALAALVSFAFGLFPKHLSPPDSFEMTATWYGMIVLLSVFAKTVSYSFNPRTPWLLFHSLVGGQRVFYTVLFAVTVPLLALLLSVTVPVCLALAGVSYKVAVPISLFATLFVILATGPSLREWSLMGEFRPPAASAGGRSGVKRPKVQSQKRASRSTRSSKTNNLWIYSVASLAAGVALLAFSPGLELTVAASLAALAVGILRHASPEVTSEHLDWLRTTPWHDQRPIPFGSPGVPAIDAVTVIAACIVVLTERPMLFALPAALYLFVTILLLYTEPSSKPRPLLRALIVASLLFCRWPHLWILAQIPLLAAVLKLSRRDIQSLISNVPGATGTLTTIEECLGRPLNQIRATIPFDSPSRFTRLQSVFLWVSVLYVVGVCARNPLGDWLKLLTALIYLIQLVVGIPWDIVKTRYLNYLMPWGLRARLSTLRLFVPSYDSTLLLIFIYTSLAISLPYLLWHTPVPLSLILPVSYLVVGTLYAITLPDLPQWQLTALHRPREGLPKFTIQAESAPQQNRLPGLNRFFTLAAHPFIPPVFG